MKFVARKEELKTLKAEFSKKESSFIAVYGRRRIGKTELINHFLSQQAGILFSVTGAYDVGLKAHLAHFSNKLSLVFVGQRRNSLHGMRLSGCFKMS